MKQYTKAKVYNNNHIQDYIKLSHNSIEGEIKGEPNGF